jgi:hypothetical protein
MLMALQGRWRGYWVQTFWGRQPMRLTLRLSEGLIEGEGDDIVGAFTFRGQYDTQGRVSMLKQYIGRHQVLYEGAYDGEGTISGTWTIPPLWRGPFALRLEAADSAEGIEREITQLVPTAQQAVRLGRAMEPVE